MNSQKGLSQVASIIMVIIVGIIAAGGVWYYWQYRVLPDLTRSEKAVTPQNVNNNTTNNATNKSNNNAKNNTNNTSVNKMNTNNSY